MNMETNLFSVVHEQYILAVNFASRAPIPITVLKINKMKKMKENASKK